MSRLFKPPFKLGKEAGAAGLIGANYITDSENKIVCEVFNIPLHTPISDLKSDARIKKHYKVGIREAYRMVDILNGEYQNY